METARPAQRTRASCAEKAPRRRAKGRTITAAASDTNAPSVCPRCRWARFAGSWMVSVTGVVAAPAAIDEGEKVAVAPGGRPLTLKAIDAGIAVPEGLTESTYVALL